MDADIRRQIRASVDNYAKRPASDRAERIAVLEENIARLEGRDGHALDRVAENQLELAALQEVNERASKLDEIFGIFNDNTGGKTPDEGVN